ncbi:hypothetical protein [Bacillus methanolicus]|uniref:Uncharacterized protein n=1 Tax=Bacillus methanolicus (strain MGA3 / ATCC 53907) TaxID=796606 RepID=I3DUB7_BACMM|nr:hypothetical protein [Bacillus methanolicus]AIE61276.1 hypothetical protein BMMGA3_14590 [Bacillus methanolicus MGA3]EIJ77838.1 hypothetical protein MGA3_15846 [Bacillus methanolicus MGA3]
MAPARKEKTDKSLVQEIGKELSFDLGLDLLFFLLRGVWLGIRRVFL